MADEPTLEHDDISRIEALLRDLDVADLEPVAPPADVWEGIHAELRREWDDRPEQHSTGAQVVDLRSRRARRYGMLLAVAAAAVLAIGGAGMMVGGSADEAVVARAELGYQSGPGFDALGASATAQAELVERDGRYEIVLEDADLPSDLGEPADLELWLIETDAEGNIVDIASVAVVEGAGTYDVPSSIDVETHRIVDISIEPRDGDASHSSRSILRGTLSA
jgi:hypothetical protein